MSYVKFREDVLIDLDRELGTSSATVISVSEFLQSRQEWDSTDFNDAVVDLKTMGFLSISETQRDKFIDVTDRGSDRAEHLLATRFSDDFVGDDKSANHLVPAADRIVTLDHNAPETIEALESVQGVLDAVTQSNEIGSDDPDEKDRVEAELEAGRRLLEANSIDFGKLAAVLVKTLRYIFEKFASSAIGKLAARALEAIDNLLE